MESLELKNKSYNIKNITSKPSLEINSENMLENRLKSKNELIKKESMSWMSINNIEKHLDIPLSYSEKKIKEIYNIENKSLGKGQFGKVKIGSFIDNNYRNFAIKMVKKKDLKDSLFLIANELNIIRSWDHPNIIRFYETYFNRRYIYFVMELCTGGTLEDLMGTKKRLSESVAKDYIFQILWSLNHLHYNNIVHRDIKSENILFLNEDRKLIKLTDFGLSKNKGINKMTTLVGSPYYIAPEILDNNYDYRCDFWSVGILIYYLLSGDFPFDNESTAITFELIKKGKFNFNNIFWEEVSNEAKELIKGFITVNPNDRLTINEAIDRPWFKEVNLKYLQTGKEILLSNSYINNLLNFNCKSIFKMEILKLSVHLFDNDDIINDIRMSYFYLDYLNNGCITKNELIQFFDEEYIPYTESQIDNLLKNLNLNSESHITYTEFIISTINVKEFLFEERIKILYNRFNSDGTDGITLINLKEVFSRFGFLYEDDYLKKMIQEFDYLKNDKITIEEFKNIMLN